MVPVNVRLLLCLDTVRKLKTPNYCVILIRFFLQPVQVHTDRHLIKSSYILIHNNVANWREVYVPLAILTA